jgi:undecaprenyl-phosphate 4-deoxy-4-formamido-L-arabinose transferase
MGPSVSVDVLLTWATGRFASVRVRHDARAIDESNYTLRKLILHTLNLTTGFSTIPLQMASILGFALTGVGVVMILYVLGEFFLFGSPVRGFTFLASSIALFSGAQLLALGIIGEYLSRLHFRSMGRPTYAVREEVGDSKVEKVKASGSANPS